jgi:uncharacterized membrane protein
VRQLAAAYERARIHAAHEHDASAPAVVIGGSDGACFQGLGDLPGGSFESFAFCLSSDGSTVGGGSASDRHVSREPFVWRAETGMVPLGAAGWGWVTALSADGSVAVGWTESPIERAFRWTRSEGWVDLHASDGAPTLAYSLSDDGLLVAGQSCAGEWRHVSTWSPDRGWARLDAGVEYPSTATSLSRDGRWAAGNVRRVFDAPQQAARWSMSGGEKAIVARASTANSVSDGGTVVGYFEHEDASQGRLAPEAMLWTGDEPPRSLGDLRGGTLDSDATAILPDGTWIAGRGTSALGDEAVLWDEARRLHRVIDLFDAARVSVPSGWRLSACQAIVRNGDLLTICGNGTNRAGDPEAWVARVRVARSVPPSAASAAR